MSLLPQSSPLLLSSYYSIMTRFLNEAVNNIFPTCQIGQRFNHRDPTWKAAARRVHQHVYDKNSPKKRKEKKQQKDKSKDNDSNEHDMTHEKAYDHLRQIQLNAVRPPFSRCSSFPHLCGSPSPRMSRCKKCRRITVSYSDA